EVVGDFEGFIFGNAEARAGFVIVVVGDGNDGVGAVVAAGELQDDQDAIGAADALGIGSEFGGHGAAGAVEEERDGCGGAEDLHAAVQEQSSGEEKVVGV